MRYHMYERYKYPIDKGLLNRRKFLIEKIQNLKCKNHNYKVAEKVTGKQLDDISFEIKEAEQMFLWVNCEIQEETFMYNKLDDDRSVWVKKPIL